MAFAQNQLFLVLILKQKTAFICLNKIHKMHIKVFFSNLNPLSFDLYNTRTDTVVSCHQKN